MDIEHAGKTETMGKEDGEKLAEGSEEGAKATEDSTKKPEEDTKKPEKEEEVQEGETASNESSFDRASSPEDVDDEWTVVNDENKEAAASAAREVVIPISVEDRGEPSKKPEVESKKEEEDEEAVEVPIKVCRDGIN